MFTPLWPRKAENRTDDPFVSARWNAREPEPEKRGVSNEIGVNHGASTKKRTSTPRRYGIPVIISILLAVLAGLAICPSANGCAGTIGCPGIHSITSIIFPNSILPRYPGDVRIQDTLLRLAGIVPLRDYALEADGGSVDDALTTPRNTWEFSKTYPIEAIRESLRVGDCWSIGAPMGQIGLSLAMPIRPRRVTIDHLHYLTAAKVGEAPKSMSLWGVVDGIRNMEIVESLKAARNIGLNDTAGPSIGGRHTYIRLTAFDYVIPSDFATQTFPVFDHIMESDLDVGVVVLEITENYGAETTCLYRVRVHGDPQEL
ncbi:hypothetical protein PHLGIDRAFT_131093 [Phlebiopsis gigantea 11061_1 CR5-6]|uniref:SUN domain-containing protein n=1 Tax=Phlebiopsis gigantea (strain 11061_1 CR5-6) TaxID=745531 RepID=A0A0C3RQ65_PHLG1|nr:hypothetical protein PHLGIDRAFT_131093 [Phlebiopsis gigantea 11061_1 CR5-6]